MNECKLYQIIQMMLYLLVFDLSEAGLSTIQSRLLLLHLKACDCDVLNDDMYVCM